MRKTLIAAAALLAVSGCAFADDLKSFHTKDKFETAGYDVALWRLNAARYGVPQRRERVVIVGVPIGGKLPEQPPAWTVPGGEGCILATPSVRDVLDDLPALKAGEDASALAYRVSPLTEYQRLMRGEVLPPRYLDGAQVDSDQQCGAVQSCFDFA